MKQTKRAQCAKCERVFDPSLHPGWQIAAGTAGLIVGSLITESFFGGVVIGGLSYAAARFADRHYALRCPSCGGRASWVREEVPERPEEAPEEVRRAA